MVYAVDANGNTDAPYVQGEYYEQQPLQNFNEDGEGSFQDENHDYGLEKEEGNGEESHGEDGDENEYEACGSL